MRIEHALLRFMAMGVGPWAQIGWSNGRGVYATQLGEDVITINLFTPPDDIPIRTGLLITSELIEPEHCYTEDLDRIEEWMRCYCLAIGDEA